MSARVLSSSCKAAALLTAMYASRCSCCLRCVQIYNHTLIFLAAAGLSRERSLRAIPKVVPLDDTQAWEEIQLTVPLHRQIDLVIIGHLRIGRAVSALVDERGRAPSHSR